MKHILKCQKCDKYTLSNKCDCGGKAIENKPPKYSPEDKYGAYIYIVLYGKDLYIINLEYNYSGYYHILR